MSSHDHSQTSGNARQAVEAALERFQQTESDIHAFEWLSEAQVRAEATFQDQRVESAPLAGMVIGIKDLIDTAAAPTTYGSPIYQAHRPTEDAPVVIRLREAGAVPFGKTVTTEFALFNPPKTRNPWNLAHTPGGSSSGSAAAVAAGVVPVALGTQTAGSIIRPAAFCGIFGFKPSFGSLPAEGLKKISPSLDTVGLLAKRLDDIHVVFDAIRVCQKKQQDLPEKLIVSFMRTPWWQSVDSEIRERTEEVVQRLAEHSQLFKVQGSTADDMFEALTIAQQVLMGTEVLANLASERRDHASSISVLLNNYLDQADRLTPADLEKAHEIIKRVKENPDLVFGEADLILSPATLSEAPVHDTTGDPLLCRAWTALGIPCISLPIGQGTNSLPIAIQIAARPGCDDLLLAAAASIAEYLDIKEALAPPMYR